MRERGESREKTTNLNEKLRGFTVNENVRVTNCYKVAYIALQGT